MTAEEAELTQLAIRAAAGDRGATEELLFRIRPLVVRYCRARLGWINGGAYTSADDVAQEVCISVLQALPRFRDMGRPFEAFVYGIAARKVSDVYRGVARDLTDPVDKVPDHADTNGGPETEAIMADTARQLTSLLEQLPRQQREVLVLRIAVGMSAEEVGAILGMSPGAVRVAQHRALGRLRAIAAGVLDEARL